MNRSARLPVFLAALWISLSAAHTAAFANATHQPDEKTTRTSPYRRLPPHFGKLKLKPAQIEEIYEIREVYGEKLARLQRQMTELREEQTTALDDVLTRTQQTALKKFRQSKTVGKPTDKSPSKSASSRTASKAAKEPADDEKTTAAKSTGKKGKSASKKSSKPASKDDAK